VARSASLAKIAARQLGPLKGGRAIAFMWQWLIWRERRDVEPRTITEAIEAYAAYWGESESTVWSHLQRFREAFPGEETPDRLLDQVADQIDARRGVRGLGAAVTA
jgi:hypothetical protein